MKLTVKRIDLLRELNLVQSVVERRSAIPVLSNLLIEAGKEGIEITASDLDVTLRTTCPAEVDEAGVVTVPAKKLFDIVKLLPDLDIAFQLGKGDALTVTCAKSKFKLAGQPTDNFPTMPTLPWLASPGATQNGASQKEAPAPKPLPLPGSVLRTLIQRTIFAITQEESRYTLSGALMILKADSIRMVSTDGHRLSLVTKTMALEGLQDELRVIVPRKTLGELVKLAPDEGPVLFGKDENHLFFQVGARVLISRVLAGQFPNYELVIPKDNDQVVGFNTAQLSHALRRVAVLADERSHAIKLILNQEHAEVTAESSEADHAHEVVPISTGVDTEAAGDAPASATSSKKGRSNGARLEVGFNAQYLLDFLNVAGSESVSLAFKDAETQVLMKPSTDADYDTRYTIMPLRLA